MQRSDTSAGTVWAWGDNTFGQVGDGTTTHRSLPVQVPGLDGVAQLAGGGGHTVVRRHDGTVLAWGRNDYGQAGDGTTDHRSAPVPVTGLPKVKTIVGGGGHTLALLDDGTVKAWGHNGRGEAGDTTTDNRTEAVTVTDLANVAAVAWGGGHSVALRADGTVWAWGHNLFGGLGDGSTDTRLAPVRTLEIDGVTEVVGGGGHTLALREDGTLWAWGRNDRGQVGDGTTETRLTPVPVQGLDDVKVRSFICGYFHSLLVDEDGTLWAWGNNDSGQLGDGTTTNRSLPQRVEGLPPVAAVAGGGGRNEFGPGGHTLVLGQDNTLWAFGLNDAGQLGDGTTENRTRPVQVLGLDDGRTTTAIFAGGGYSGALRD
ncbi:RCC1 domain-containing protein [Streptomyces sp. NPDC002851]